MGLLGGQGSRTVTFACPISVSVSSGGNTLIFLWESCPFTKPCGLDRGDISSVPRGGTWCTWLISVLCPRQAKPGNEITLRNSLISWKEDTCLPSGLGTVTMSIGQGPWHREHWPASEADTEGSSSLLYRDSFLMTSVKHLEPSWPEAEVSSVLQSCKAIYIIPFADVFITIAISTILKNPTSTVSISMKIWDTPGKRKHKFILESDYNDIITYIEA